MRLDDHLVDVLLRPIKQSRVKQAQGFSHVEAWDIRATLIRMFGFCGFSVMEVSPATCIYERERKLSSGKDGVAIAYKAHIAIVIHLPDGDVTYSGSAVGEAINQASNAGDAHDQALKTAESQALKRAATNLGDQFGLGLYDEGSTNAVVLRIVGYNDEDRAAAVPPTAAAAPSGTLAPSEVPEDDPIYTDPK